MRTSGTLLAVLGLVVGCGGGSSNNGGGYTSPTGRTADSGGALCKGTSCAAQDSYYACLKGKCGTQAQTCFGASYSSGQFSGPCAAYIACNLACPCDATGTLCLANCYVSATAECQSCVTTLRTCSSAAETVAACGQEATCAAVDSGTTPTGTGCAAAQACCAKLGATLGAQVATACQSQLAGLTDAQCDQVLVSYQTYCQ